MGQISITLNNRTYRLICDDGEEDRLVELAGYVKAKVEHLADEVGVVGDERLILMVALQIADELWEARAEVEALTAPDAEVDSAQQLQDIAAQMAAHIDGQPVVDDRAKGAAVAKAPVGRLAAAQLRQRGGG